MRGKTSRRREQSLHSILVGRKHIQAVALYHRLLDRHVIQGQAAPGSGRNERSHTSKKSFIRGNVGVA